MRTQRTGRIGAGRAALVVALGLTLAGCVTARPTGPEGGGDLAMALRHWGEQYNRNPADGRAAFAFARALIASDQRGQAIAVLQRAVIANSGDSFLQGELGKALAADGRFDEAQRLFAQAHSPDRPDWRILSAHGAVLDQLNRPQEARRLYQQALTLAPAEPAVLSNLGMSHILTGELALAEQHLRAAASATRADPRVRQNLALVIGLQGRVAEAEQLAGQTASPQEAQANVEALRAMLRQTPAATRTADAARARAVASGPPQRLPTPPAGTVARAPQR